MPRNQLTVSDVIETMYAVYLAEYGDEAAAESAAAAVVNDMIVTARVKDRSARSSSSSKPRNRPARIARIRAAAEALTPAAAAR